jgi:hypothetical protein
MIGIKGFAEFEHSKDDMNELAHGGANDFHFVFAGVSQALTESADNRVVTFRDRAGKKSALRSTKVLVFIDFLPGEQDIA